MARKEFLESKKGPFSYGHHQQRSTMMSSCTNRQQQVTRKPPLPLKGPSSAPSKIPSLKKISELKRTSTRALNLPVLNLDKVRRNFLEQAELASYGGSRGLCAEPPKVNSARYSTEKSQTERRSFLSGSLTERGARELLAERRITTSGTLTDRSCRQSYDRKSVTSGSVTDRSCRESFGSSYGLSLSNYLRNSRDSPLRSSKEGPLTAPIMPKVKLDDRLNGNRLQSESRKSRGDKSAKYHSSISLSTYPPSTNPPMHASLSSRNCHNDALGTSKHSNLVRTTSICSKEGSDCKSNGDFRSLQIGTGLEGTRTNTSKAELGSWDAKRLPIQLVNTLEEALQGVSRTEFSFSEAKKAPGMHSKSTQDLIVAKTTGKLSGVKPSSQMDKVKAQARDMRRSQEDLCLDELATSRRQYIFNFWSLIISIRSRCYAYLKIQTITNNILE
ncbi:hypothetical protein L7F22_034225 [Adiantum nelumboides]|nr:hypothetical protein [Adiantum nelumboides]